MSIDIADFYRLIPPAEPTKIGHVLHRLCCGVRPTRFDAEKSLHDHCLPTTISDLANDYLVEIHRERVKVPNFLGQSTWCAKYSIKASQENLLHCYQLLKFWGYRLPGEHEEKAPPEAAA